MQMRIIYDSNKSRLDSHYLSHAYLHPGKFIVINVQPSKELFIDSQSLGGLKYPAGWISVLLLLLDCNHGTSQYKDVKYRSPC